MKGAFERAFIADIDKTISRYGMIAAGDHIKTSEHCQKRYGYGQSARQKPIRLYQPVQVRSYPDPGQLPGNTLLLFHFALLVSVSIRLTLQMIMECRRLTDVPASDEAEPVPQW